MIDLLHLDIQEEMELGVELPSIDEKIDIGKGRVIQEGKKVAISKLWYKT